jgi:hypothetical protein
MKAPLLALVVALVAGSAMAADYKAPRTPFGHPDLQGVWNNEFILPLEATPGVPNLVVSEAESRVIARRVADDAASFASLQIDPEVPDMLEAQARKGLALVRGERRTRQVVQPADGKLPLTPRGRSMVTFVDNVLRTSPEPPIPANNPEERPNWERCVVGQGQPPINAVTGANPRQILQTKEAVVILTEYGGDLRIVPFSDKHGPPQITSLLGDSIARWEGDTLVIETIRMPAKDVVRPFPTLLVPPSATVIERYTRIADKELLYQYTVVDKGAYTAPWMAEYSLYRGKGPIYEFACHEGNYSLPSILSGARQKEQTARPSPR